jgi:hypothetical protein
MHLVGNTTNYLLLRILETDSGRLLPFTTGKYVANSLSPLFSRVFSKAIGALQRSALKITTSIVNSCFLGIHRKTVLR